MNPLLRLGQRFTVDWLNSADASVPPEIMTPDYLVHIGGISLDGLSAYVDGTLGQLRQFPGLALTIHDVMTDGSSRLALVFTEHGASAKHDFAPAAWRGVALFRVVDGMLAENWTQEDYYGRRRQLSSRQADVIAAPLVAPWTTTAESRAVDSEKVVLDWLSSPELSSVTVDDGSPLTCLVSGVEVDELFSAGNRVAFAATWTGTYSGGLDGVASAGAPVSLGCAGVVTVSDGVVTGGTVVSDRLGLRKSLLPPR